VREFVRLDRCMQMISPSVAKLWSSSCRDSARQGSFTVRCIRQLCTACGCSVVASAACGEGVVYPMCAERYQASRRRLNMLQRCVRRHFK
jgi:hypothetical protein